MTTLSGVIGPRAEANVNVRDLDRFMYDQSPFAARQAAAAASVGGMAVETVAQAPEAARSAAQVPAPRPELWTPEIATA